MDPKHDSLLSTHFDRVYSVVDKVSSSALAEERL